MPCYIIKYLETTSTVTKNAQTNCFQLLYGAFWQSMVPRLQIKGYMAPLRVVEDAKFHSC